MSFERGISYEDEGGEKASPFSPTEPAQSTDQMSLKNRGDGHALFGKIRPGAKFIMLQSDDKVVRDNYSSTGVEIYVKLWNPTTWTKRWEGERAAATDHPTAINLNNGAPTHIPDDQEVNIIYL